MHCKTEKIGLFSIKWGVLLALVHATIAPAIVTYDDVNKKIFTPICASCHSGGFPDADLDLTSYESITKQGVVVAGDPDKSLLIQKVVSGAMPAGGPPLAADQIQLLKDWVRDGALATPPALVLNLKSIQPLFGSMKGGYLVELKGENFTDGMKATINGIPCKDLKVVDATKLSCRVPKSESAGKVDVAVTDGTTTSVLEKSFEYRLPLGPTFASLYTNIFQPKCIGCHSGDNPPHDLDISTYESLLSHRRAIKPGDLKKSRLYRMVERGKMPLKTTPGGTRRDDDDPEGDDDDGQADPLSKEEISAIKDWILEGAQNN